MKVVSSELREHTHRDTTSALLSTSRFSRALTWVVCQSQWSTLPSLLTSSGQGQNSSNTGQPWMGSLAPLTRLHTSPTQQKLQVLLIVRKFSGKFAFLARPTIPFPFSKDKVLFLECANIYPLIIKAD